jgi:site-specific DNA recombinase
VHAGIYARLSRVKTTTELTTAAMERQEGDCRELCDKRGWTVVKVYPDEGLSAAPGAKRRPEFENALADLAAKRIGVLVIWKLDRFLRSLWDLLRVEKILSESGGQLVSVQDGWLDTTTGPGRYMLRQYALLGEMEIDNIRVRVTRWHRQRAAAGLPLVSGRRPFGYATNDRSVVDPIEAEVIREAARRLLAGKSLRSIVAWINDDLGVTAPNGKPWQPSNVRQMLLSPGIAGLRSYKGAPPIKGTWQPILDRPTWEAVCGVLTEPSRFRAGRPAAHLLSGLVACGVCESPMHTHYRIDGVRQYGCRARPGTKACGKLTVKAEPVDDLVAKMVLKKLAGPAFRATLLDRETPSADRERLQEEFETAKAHRDEIEALYKARKLKADAFLRLHGPAEAEVEHARARLAELGRRRVLDELPHTAKGLRDWWDSPTTEMEQRRAVLQAALVKVLVGPSGPRQSQFDPSRLRPPYGPVWRG